MPACNRLLVGLLGPLFGTALQRDMETLLGAAMCQRKRTTAAGI
jgi:hypothetical protein